MVRSTALFEQRGQARRVRRALEAARFECIEIGAPDPDAADDDSVDGDDLRRLGFGDHEADWYAAVIDGGTTVLMVGCVPGRIEELFEIMARFDLRKTSRSHQADRIRFRRPTSRSSTTATSTTDDSDAPKDETPSTSPVPRSLTGAFPGIFDRFEPSFRRHYDRHLADDDTSYAPFARAYHYGVVLAEYAGFRDRHWEKIEPFARQGWDEKNHGPWPRFREATRYGWQAVQDRRRR